MKRQPTFADLRKRRQMPLDLPLTAPPDARHRPMVMTHYYGKDNEWHELKGFENCVLNCERTESNGTN